MPLIILNPGHCLPEDPGACGNNLQEADLTVSICDRIISHLALYDVEVAVVRQNDLNLIACKANNLKADYFCSIHINAGGGEGFESYVHTNASEETEKLRSVVHDQTVRFLAGQGVVDRSKKRANFAVLRQTNMPAVLLENLFIDNEQDATKLKDETFLDGLANEIAYGLVVALGLQKKVVAEPVQVSASSHHGVTIKAGGKSFPAIMVDGKTYGPIRDVCEALGHRVTWYGEDQIVKAE